MQKPKKTLKELNLLESIWIKENDVIYEGWVFDITRRCIIILYSPDLKDFKFRIDKFLDQTEVTQDNKTLYCNEPSEPYIKISQE